MKPAASLDELEARLGYVFDDRALLERALVHRSLVNESDLQATDSNERLEFLGDAALELAATTYLYDRHPDRLEGELSAARAALVNLHARPAAPRPSAWPILSAPVPATSCTAAARAPP